MAEYSEAKRKKRPRTLDIAKLAERFTAAEADKVVFMEGCEQIRKFIAPYSGARMIPLTESESSVEWRATPVWDFTAIDGSQKLAANLHGGITSSSIKWYRLQLRDKTTLDDPEARQYADDVTDITFDALQDSDFNTEVSSSYQDLVNFGNSFVMCESMNETVWEGIDFTTIPLEEAFFEDGHKGQLKAFFRRMSWSTTAIVDKFGEDVPDCISEAMNSADGRRKRWEVIFAIDERTDRMKIWKAYKRKPAKLAKHLRPWGCTYFLRENQEPLGEEGGFYEMPVLHGVWEKTAGSLWGHGPGHLALPTVRYLNAWLEIQKKAQEKAIEPTTLVSERGLLSDMDHAPSKFVVVRDPEKDVKVLESGSKFNVAQEAITDLRMMIRQIFHTDELQLKDSPAMTATEVQVRYELMNRVLGSTLARLQSEFLDPLLHLVIAILARANQLPDKPASVKKSGDYGLEYQGPLSRAQRTDEVAAIERGAAFAAGLLKMGFDEVRDDFDPGEALRETFKRLGVPAKVTPTAAQSTRRRKARQEAQSRAAAAEVRRAEGEAAQQEADAAAAGRANGSGLPISAQPTPVVAPPIQ